MIRSREEEWRPVPGFEGLYVVSNLGRLRSLRHHGRIIPQKPNSDGYPRARLSKDGVQKHYRVHRLVAMAFHGDKQNILHNEVAHLDGDRSNARSDNLKWVSRLENYSHRRIHGTDQVGERHHRAKLTEQAVREIRASASSFGSLAARYAVSPRTISDVRRRRRWAHVE